MFIEGQVYHIFNRANGSENLFREDKNYHSATCLILMQKHIIKSMKHGFVSNPLEWPYSSIQYYLNDSVFQLQIGSEILKNGINEVIDWFGGIDHFKELHTLYNPCNEIRLNDFEI